MKTGVDTYEDCHNSSFLLLVSKFLKWISLLQRIILHCVSACVILWCTVTEDNDLSASESLQVNYGHSVCWLYDLLSVSEVHGGLLMHSSPMWKTTSNMWLINVVTRNNGQNICADGWSTKNTLMTSNICQHSHF